jgi:diphthamide biosynthesis enzyme Dph1/Dph2-like protein
LDAAILTANAFDFESLNNMLEFDAFVNTACPRVGIDDIGRTRVPLLTSDELMDVIKMRKEQRELKKAMNLESPNL